jgi:hypothetical protein
MSDYKTFVLFEILVFCFAFGFVHDFHSLFFIWCVLLVAPVASGMLFTQETRPSISCGRLQPMVSSTSYTRNMYLIVATPHKPGTTTR